MPRHHLGAQQERVALARLHRDADAELARERRRPRPGGEHEGVGRHVALRRVGGADCAVGPVEAGDLRLLDDLDAHLAELRPESDGHRVGLHVPLSLQVEARLHAVVERRLDRLDLVLAEDVVRQVVAVLAHPFQAAQHLARLLGLGRRAHHAELPEVELDPVVDHLVDELEGALAERGERRGARVVVALVAVRPEAQQPGGQVRQVARPEVERRIRADEGAEAVDRQAGLGQRACLGRRDPAAIAPRRRGARADVRAVENRHLDVALAQVVRAAEAGDSGADDRDLHPGMPAVASTSISIPGMVKPVTIVVRTGRGAAKYSAQSSFQAPKSSALSR